MYQYYKSIHSQPFNHDQIKQPYIPLANQQNASPVSAASSFSSLDKTSTRAGTILPNFPYSPFPSPQVSPEHRLHPQSASASAKINIIPPSIIESSSLINIAVEDPPTSRINQINNSLRELRSRNLTNHSVVPLSASSVQLNQYNILQQLGQGSYGLVQLAYNKEDSRYYAMKILSKKKLLKSCGLFNRSPPIRKSSSSASSVGGLRSPNKTIRDPLEKIYREIAIHKKLNHPHIVRLIEVLDDPSQQYLYMVFEYLENGAVMNIGKDEPFTEELARKYFTDTLLGLEYLHYQKIIHRDIKPANLLLSRLNQIKIADFGVSNEFSGDDVLLSSTAGSPAFMAPESLRDGESTFAGKALDVWALGITLYAFLYSKVPYEHFNRFLLYQMIINNSVTYPSFPEISQSAQNLLEKMLDKDPITRIKIHEIKKDLWVTNENTKILPSESKNCGKTLIEVTEEEVANSIYRVPRLETVIKVKMLLKQKSFRNPLHTSSSITKLSTNDDSTPDDFMTLPITELNKKCEEQLNENTSHGNIINPAQENISENNHN